MAAPNFSALMNKPLGDIKRPPVLPEGTYFGTITGYELYESSQKKTPGCRIQGTLSHAHEDVELVDEAGTAIDVSGKKFPQRGSTFWLSDDALFMLAEFLQGYGMDLSDMSLGQALPQLTGQSIQLDIIQVPIQNQTTGETTMSNEVKRMIAPQG